MGIDEIAIFVSTLTAIYATYQAWLSNKRTTQQDVAHEATETAVVVVKLENISENILEVKNAVTQIREEVRENKDRIILVEEIAKSAHKRMDVHERFHSKDRINPERSHHDSRDSD